MRLRTSFEMGALYFLWVEASRLGLGVTVARVSRSIDVLCVTGRFGVKGVGRTTLDVPGFVDMVLMLEGETKSTSRDRVVKKIPFGDIGKHVHTNIFGRFHIHDDALQTSSDFGEVSWFLNGIVYVLLSVS